MNPYPLELAIGTLVYTWYLACSTYPVRLYKSQNASGKTAGDQYQYRQLPQPSHLIDSHKPRQPTAFPFNYRRFQVVIADALVNRAESERETESAQCEGTRGKRQTDRPSALQPVTWVSHTGNTGTARVGF